MNTFKSRLFAAATRHTLPLIVLAAVVSPAWASQDAGAEACRKAFSNTPSAQPTDGSSVHMKFLNKGYVPTESQYAENQYSYDLVAVHAVTGRMHARATCTADAGGNVTSLQVESLHGVKGRAPQR